jgi:HEAT repeat protein
LTPEERQRVYRLAVIPGRGTAISKKEFLREFGATDGVALGLDLLADAVQRRDPEDVEWALIVCFTFGFTIQHRDILIDLAFADWHQRHEDVAGALSDIGSPKAIGALVHLATWVPDYLEFDEARALATKAIWGLGSVHTAAATEALRELAKSDSPVVARGALAQLQR